MQGLENILHRNKLISDFFFTFFYLEVRNKGREEGKKKGREKGRRERRESARKRKEGGKERKGAQRDNSYKLTHSPNVHNSGGQRRPEPGAENVIQVSIRTAKIQLFELSCVASQG